MKAKPKTHQTADRTSMSALPVSVVQPSGQRPTKVFRSGACSACIFFNRVILDGQTVEKPCVSFSKLYIKQGLMRKTSSLRPEDLPSAILVLGQAYEWLKQVGEDPEEVVWHG